MGVAEAVPGLRGTGYVDHIDLFRDVMYLHCTECGHRYELTKAEVDAHVAIA